MDKRIVSKELFQLGKTHREISKLLNISHATIRSWSQRDGWIKLGDANSHDAHKTGRRCKYNEYVKPRLKEIEEWKSNGFAECEIAIKLNISYSTFRDFKKKFPAFSAVLKKGDANLIDKAEEILHKKACGEYIEEIEIINYDDEGNIVKDKKTGIARQVTKRKTADTTANIFLIKQRKADKYNLELQHKKKTDEENSILTKELNEHRKKMDEEKLKLEKEKINREDNETDNTKAIKDFLNATRPSKKELDEMFDEE